MRVALALAPGAAVGLWMIMAASSNRFGGRRFILADDAMISMTYARTLARGGGLVWYEGAGRVEGITNPLWTLYMALLHAVGLEGSRAAAVVAFTGLATVLATAWVAGQLTLRIARGAERASLFVTATVALSFPLLYWSTQGMEVGLFALLAVLAVDLAAAQVRNPEDVAGPSRRNLVTLAAVLAVGCLVRSDFIIVAAVVTAWSIWSAPSPRERRAVATLLIGATVLTFGATTAARFAYYGEIVPNTYVLKMDGVSPFVRIERGLSVSLPYVPIMLLGLGGAIMLLRRTSDPQRRIVLLVAAVWITQFVYGIWVGGDAWEFITSRFIATVSVFTAVLALAASGVTSHKEGRSTDVGKLVTAIGGLLIAMWILPWTHRILDPLLPGFGYAIAAPVLAVGFALWASSARPARTIGTTKQVSSLINTAGPAIFTAVAVFFATNGGGITAHRVGLIDSYNAAVQFKSDYGLRVAGLLRPGGTMAVTWAGSQVYYADRPAIDLLGKSDATIARTGPKGTFYPGHNKWDYRRSVTDLRPDVIADPEVISMISPGDTDFQQIRTDDAYERRCLLMDDRGSLATVWVRSDSPNVDKSSPRLVSCP